MNYKLKAFLIVLSILSFSIIATLLVGYSPLLFGSTIIIVGLGIMYKLIFESL